MAAINQARFNLGHVRALIGLGQTVGAQTTGVLSVDDVYRAGLLLAVSALDHYVHERIVEEMLAVHSRGTRRTKGYEQFGVSLGAIDLSNPTNQGWLEAEIRARNSYVTYQRPDRISQGFALFSTTKVWPAVARVLGSDAQSVQVQLNLIVDRRNQIAHEADTIPGQPGSRWPISDTIALDALNFIEQVIVALDSAV